MKLKKLLLTLATAALALTPLTSASAAAETGNADISEKLPDNRELEAAYLEKLFYGGGAAPLADYGRHTLTGTTLEVYETLRTEIEKIAAGEKTDTKINVAVSGYSSFNAFGADIEKVVHYLLADLPEDFYWFDKTESGGCAYSRIGTEYTVAFAVADSYADKTAKPEDGIYYTIDSAKITAAKKAVANAQSIIEKYDGKSGYEKVLGYCAEICALVEYNKAAADDDTTPYGDPWQLVYVFDGDDTTNVVCEGYSKAMQYLCDLGGVDCYTVTGSTDGNHMWNIVELGGRSYLVDVTNCDEGAVGAGGNLALKGATTSSASGFYFVISSSKNMTYTYDEDTLLMYPAELLTVSTEDFSAEVCEHTFVGNVCEDCGKAVDPEEIVHVTGITVSPEVGTLHIGSTAELTAALEPLNTTENIIAWSSGNEEVLTVSAGDGGKTAIITALSAGSADITAAVSNTSVSAVQTVTVTGHDYEWKYDDSKHWQECFCGDKTAEAAHNFADGVCSDCGYKLSEQIEITVEPKEATVLVGKTVTLTVSCSSDGGSFSVTSSDPEVATAIMGRDRITVTGVAEGSAVITCTFTTTDGSESVSADCAITVERGEIAPVIEGVPSAYKPAAADKSGIEREILNMASVAGLPDDISESDYRLTAELSEDICTVAFALTESGAKKYKLGSGALTEVTCVITQDEPQKRYIIRITPESSLLYLGDTLALNAVVSENGTPLAAPAVTWATSNPSAATVNGGVVTPVGTGTADIIASYNAGEQGVISAVCKVTVVNGDSMVLSAGELTISAGNTATLTATVIIKGETVAAPQISWSSDRPNVAKVENGVITAVSEGKTVITAICGTVSASCMVTVTAAGSDEPAPPVPPVEQKTVVTLDTASATLHAGDTLQITATASKGGTAISDAVFTWRSDKERVVKVNNKGEAVAVGIGTATVTAEYDGVKASCVITVEARPVLTLTPSTLRLRKGKESTLKLKVTVGGKTVSDPAVEWNSSNTDVAVVEDGVVTAEKAGTAVITAEYDGVKAACTVTVTTSGSTAVVRPSRPDRYPDTDTTDTADTESSDKDTPANKAKLNGLEKDWSDIAKDISEGGGTCKIELNGEKEVPSEVIRAVSASGKTVEIIVDTAVSLEINGAEVNSTLPVAFEKTEVKAENIRGTNGLGFTYSGAANTGIIAAFRQGNSGRFANMYLKSGSSFSFAGNAKISSDGSAKLNIPSVGVYVIMLSEFSDLKGDADNSGTLNALDAALILKNSAEGTKPRNSLAADYDGNGTVNALDAAFILKQIANS